jgi:hypothetical protein
LSKLSRLIEGPVWIVDTITGWKGAGLKKCFSVKTVFYAFTFLFFSFSLLHALSINLIKSVVPAVGAVGDTVTVCISIDTSALTASAKADIMWVIDTTASMTGEITGIENNIASFTSQLDAEGINYRQGLEEFRDLYDPQTGDPTEEKNYGFAASDSQFLGWVDALYAAGGGDYPEAGLDALYDAVLNTSAAQWRPDASKTLILVTDAPVKSIECGTGIYSLTYTAYDIHNNMGFVIDAVCNNITDPGYTLCNTALIPPLAGGIWLNLSSSSNWSTFLTALGSSVASYTDVLVTDPLPPELAPADSACGATITGNQLQWSFSQVGSGSLFQVCCFGAVITSSFAGSISNTAYVSANNVSQTASNNTYIFYPTVTSTFTISATYTQTPSVTPTFTITITDTKTITPTQTSTASPTYTATITPTPIIPPCLKLYQNSPNPCSSGTNIIYELCDVSDVKVRIYTISGEVVVELTQQGLPGNNSIYWDTKNKAGKGVANGVYIYSLEAVNGNQKKKAWGKLAVLK